MVGGLTNLCNAILTDWQWNGKCHVANMVKIIIWRELHYTPTERQHSAICSSHPVWNDYRGKNIQLRTPPTPTLLLPDLIYHESNGCALTLVFRRVTTHKCFRCLQHLESVSASVRMLRSKEISWHQKPHPGRKQTTVLRLTMSCWRTLLIPGA